MARYGDGRVLVFAPYRNYQNGRVSVGWLDYDKSQPFKVYRLELLRPLQEAVTSRFRSLLLFLSSDIPLRLKILGAVARIIKEEDIKVLCIGELDSGSWIGPLARIFFGCKIVNYIHGEEITTQGRYRFFGRKKRRYLDRADAIVAVSNFTKTQLIDRMGVTERKVELIYNGVDLGRFKEGHSVHPQAHTEDTGHPLSDHRRRSLPAGTGAASARDGSDR
jgi:phosphatidylinositol alpha-1,6-mannosyltransferase